MSYSTLTPPVRVWGTIAGASGWYYTSDDDDGTVMGANYVTDAQDLGMKVGDVIHIWEDDAGIGSTAWISAVASTGSTMIFSVIS